ncbi:LytTR family transcriptional regulator DNA-binding domain-containing protein [Chryseobacterium lineare]
MKIISFISKPIQETPFSINSSLGELPGILDQFKFYRADRQYIINISAVSKSWRMKKPAQNCYSKK